MGNSLKAMDASLLNADIIDRILMSLPDFKSLLATIVTCKAIYSVYRARPASIKRAVAYNLVGPALPQAVRYLRCQKSELWLKNNEELFGEDDLEKHPILEHWEIRSLADLSVLTVKLEDLYSWREKDCMFRTSRLSAMESYRFRRALYRMALFVSVYGKEACDAMDVFYDEEDDVPDIKVQGIRKMRYQFMEKFSTADLKELDSLARFLYSIYTWSSQAYGIYFPDLDCCLFSGRLPEAVLDAYDGCDLDMPEDDIASSVYDGFISCSVNDVLENRKVPRTTEEQAKEAILEERVGTGTTCKQCQATNVPRNDLWGPTNWEFFKGVINPKEMHRTLLKGYLRCSVDYGEMSNFTKIWSTNDIAKLLDEVFEQRTDAYDGWDKEDLICVTCLKNFLRDHLHLWYSHKRRKEGLVLPEDCWYGYNCRTQSHNVQHAKKLNHFCEPTRGDAAPPSLQ